MRDIFDSSNACSAPGNTLNFRIVSLLRTHLGSMRSTAFLSTHVGSRSNISLAVRVTNPPTYPVCR